MTPEYFIAVALEPALRLLPAVMDSPPARAMVIAICLQESRLQYRRQVGGPARGFAQFEAGGGVRGVLHDPQTRAHIQRVLVALDYSPASEVMRCWEAIEHNDILAAAFARLLLWTLPDSLPKRSDPAEGWKQYMDAWRPGKPHPEKWPENFKRAWAVVAP